MKYKFSKRSINNLKTCHPNLQELANRVMSLQLFDFGITCGHRDEEDQAWEYHSGRSRVDWPDSSHNANPSRAMDICLLINGKINWNSSASWYMAIGVFRGVSAMMEVPLRVGGDWDGDFSVSDQSFHDLVHMELML